MKASSGLSLAMLLMAAFRLPAIPLPTTLIVDCQVAGSDGVDAGGDAGDIEIQNGVDVVLPGEGFPEAVGDLELAAGEYRFESVHANLKVSGRVTIYCRRFFDARIEPSDPKSTVPIELTIHAGYALRWSPNGQPERSYHQVIANLAAGRVEDATSGTAGGKLTFYTPQPGGVSLTVRGGGGRGIASGGRGSDVMMLVHDGAASCTYLSSGGSALSAVGSGRPGGKGGDAGTIVLRASHLGTVRILAHGGQGGTGGQDRNTGMGLRGGDGGGGGTVLFQFADVPRTGANIEINLQGGKGGVGGQGMAGNHGPAGSPGGTGGTGGTGGNGGPPGVLAGIWESYATRVGGDGGSGGTGGAGGTGGEGGDGFSPGHGGTGGKGGDGGNSGSALAQPGKAGGGGRGGPAGWGYPEASDGQQGEIGIDGAAGEPGPPSFQVSYAHLYPVEYSLLPLYALDTEVALDLGTDVRWLDDLAPRHRRNLLATTQVPQSRHLKGVGADGVTQAILVSLASAPGTVTFTRLPGTTAGDPLESLYGHSLRQETDPRTGAAYTVEVRSPTIEADEFRGLHDFPPHAGFATYTSPLELPDNSVNSQTIQFLTEFTPYGSTRSIRQTNDFSVVRLPVLLVHGIWASPEKWTNPKPDYCYGHALTLLGIPHVALTCDRSFCFTPAYRNPATYQTLRDAGLEVYVVDYEKTATKSFKENERVLIRDIERAKSDFSGRGLAVRQVDVVGHSMGGIIARRHTQLYDRYTKENDDRGDIHRLITIGTPHRGSRLSNLRDAARRSAPCKASLFFSFLDGGGWDDLAPSSAGIASIAPTLVPCHAIVVRTHPSDEYFWPTIICWLRWVFGDTLPGPPKLDLTSTGNLIQTLFREENDRVVEASSQRGGLPGPPFISEFLNGPNHTDEPSDPVIANRVLFLLTHGRENFTPGALHDPSGLAEQLLIAWDWDAYTRGVWPYGSIFQDYPFWIDSEDGTHARLGFPAPIPDRGVLPGLHQPAPSCEETIVEAALKPIANEILDRVISVVVSEAGKVVFRLEPIADLPFRQALIRVTLGQDRYLAGVEKFPFESEFTPPKDFYGRYTIDFLLLAPPADWHGHSISVSARSGVALEDLRVTRGESTGGAIEGLQRLQVQGAFLDGVSRDLSASYHETTYVSSDPTVAVVDAEGWIRPLKTGFVTITAENSGKIASVDLQTKVAPPKVTRVRETSPGPFSTRRQIEVIGTHLETVQGLAALVDGQPSPEYLAEVLEIDPSGTLLKASISQGGRQPEGVTVLKLLSPAGGAICPPVSLGTAETAGEPSLRSGPGDLSAEEGESVLLKVDVDGHGPFAYQWYVNGRPIEGAHSRQLVIPVANRQDSGAYSLLVRGSTDVLSDEWVLVIGGAKGSALIREEPADIVGDLGGNYQLAVRAVGKAPLTFQWFRNDRELAGETNRVLKLPSLSVEDAGAYRVVVRNPLGSVTSEAAQVSLTETLRITSLVITESGDLLVEVRNTRDTRFVLEASEDLTVWKYQDREMVDSRQGEIVRLRLPPSMSLRRFYRLRQVE